MGTRNRENGAGHQGTMERESNPAFFFRHETRCGTGGIVGNGIPPPCRLDMVVRRDGLKRLRGSFRGTRGTQGGAVLVRVRVNSVKGETQGAQLKPAGLFYLTEKQSRVIAVKRITPAGGWSPFQYFPPAPLTPNPSNELQNANPSSVADRETDGALKNLPLSGGGGSAKKTGCCWFSKTVVFCLLELGKRNQKILVTT